MKHIQIELDDEENEILSAFMFLEDEKNKKIALKKMIKACINLPKIKEAIRIKKQNGNKK
ncbi:MAG: hypothetical protein WC533_00835 [Candidatus Pacearchaeota archaeon]